MADKVVEVCTSIKCISSTMDEAVIDTYITDAETAGWFESDDSTVRLLYGQVEIVNITDP